MRFKYSTTSPSQNEFDSLPRIPLVLRRGDQIVEAFGLVDSGATINVLPYEMGLQLGGAWDESKAIIQLAGNLSSQPAMPFFATAEIGEFASVKLAALLFFSQLGAMCNHHTDSILHISAIASTLP
ncbi:MAG TPA: hypothetical protein V6D15_13740 [Oculatellaceae cyanobacterium]|jgi:hypothetical protein